MWADTETRRRSRAAAGTQFRLPFDDRAAWGAQGADGRVPDRRRGVRAVPRALGRDEFRPGGAGLDRSAAGSVYPGPALGGVAERAAPATGAGRGVVDPGG